jgi:hypothetical protein
MLQKPVPRTAAADLPPTTSELAAAADLPPTTSKLAAAAPSVGMLWGQALPAATVRRAHPARLEPEVATSRTDLSLLP